MIFDLILAVSALCFGLYFIRLSAGTFNIGKLNIIHITYFLFVVMIFVGTVLVKVGFTGHYTNRLLIEKTNSVNLAFYSVVITTALWPLALYVFLRLFKIKPSNDYNKYLSKEIQTPNENITFNLLSIIGVVLLALLVMYLNEIGYIPLLKLFNAEPDFNFATERIRINGIPFMHVVVRNIFILQLIPLLSYIGFSFSLKTKKFKWIIFTLVFFSASLITKTYNFEKVPVVFHLAIFLMILIYFFGGINYRWILLFTGAGFGILLLFYSVLDFSNSFSLYNGIIARLIMTPAGMLILHFDMFPRIFGFLHGRSAPGLLLRVFGVDSASRLRSSKLMMDFYGSESTYEGTAGVMSTAFLGESYSNFGWIGIIVSILWVSFLLALVFQFFLKVRKSPTTIAFFAYFTVNIAVSTQGGFFDLIYNANWIIFVLLMLVIEYGMDVVRWTRNRVEI